MAAPDFDLDAPDTAAAQYGPEIDALRDNLSWLAIMAGGNGGRLPGWDSEFTYSGADLEQVVLTHATDSTLKIKLAYTFDAGEIDVEYFCFDSGSGWEPLTNSAMSYTFTTGDLTSVAAGTNDGSACIVSAFEDDVAALSPVALYLFRDSSFATQISDSSGNGHDLTPSIAAASRDAVTPIRSTHPGGISFDRTTSANWATNGQFYASGSGLRTAMIGATALTLIVSFRGEDHHTGQNTDCLGFFPNDNTTAYDIFRFRFMDALNDFATDVKTDLAWNGTYSNHTVADLADGVNYLWIARWDGSDVRNTLSKKTATYTPPGTSGLSGEFDGIGGYNFGLNRRGFSTTDSIGFVVDHIAILDYDIGATEESSLIATWKTEAAA